MCMACMQTTQRSREKTLGQNFIYYFDDQKRSVQTGNKFQWVEEEKEMIRCWEEMRKKRR